MYGLGRIWLPDQRDAGYTMEAELAKRKPKNVPTSKEWTPGPVLDQGQTPQCTAYAWRDHMNATPYPEPSAGPDPNTLYGEEKAIDGIKGDGSTVRAGATILKQQGLIQAFLWASSEAGLRQWVLTQSPVVLGTLWFNNMFQPDATGLVHVDANSGIAGGHAYLCIGFDGTTNSYKFQNSWGTDWAHGGFFFMSAPDVASLLAQQGEACTVLNVVSSPHGSPVEGGDVSDWSAWRDSVDQRIALQTQGLRRVTEGHYNGAAGSGAVVVALEGGQTSITPQPDPR
jgi:hypothetical protein